MTCRLFVASMFSIFVVIVLLGLFCTCEGDVALVVFTFESPAIHSEQTRSGFEPRDFGNDLVIPNIGVLVE